MSTDPYEITRVTLLTGHTDADTAYVVDDYPYGARLRCKIRYWIDTGLVGEKKGQQRLMSQTTNPKVEGESWNKPKGSTYSLITVMYLDEQDHVKSYGVTPYSLTGEGEIRTRAMGVHDQLDEEQRALYDHLMKASRKVNPITWAEWDNKVAELAVHLAENDDTPPELVNKVWVTPAGERRYLSDPAAYITAAREINARAD